MSSVNKAILIGNLGRDPEVRTTQGGSKVASLSVATSERWKDRNTGEQKEQTEWHRVVMWEKLAEVAEQYLKKGSKVYLEGRLATRKWTDNSGTERYTTEIVLSGFNSKMVMLDGKGERSSDPPPAEANTYSGQSSAAAADFDDEIPF